LVASVAWAHQAEGKRGVTPEDYFAFESSAIRASSLEGKLVAYVVTTVDQKQNRRHSSIWMAATDGSRAPWPFTTSPQNANAPRWSPDGQSLAFISSRTSADGPRVMPNLSLGSRDERRRGAPHHESEKVARTAFSGRPMGTGLPCLSRTGQSDIARRAKTAPMSVLLAYIIQVQRPPVGSTIGRGHI